MNDARQGTDVTFIGLTHRSDDAPVGGAPLVIVNLANHFVRRGLSVEVLVFTQKGVTQFPFAFRPEVRVHLLAMQSRASLLWQMIRHLSHSRPRVITTVGNKANLLTAIASHVPLNRADFWPALHHNLSAEMAGWSESKRRRRIREWRWLVNRANALICVSRGVAEDFVEVTGCRREKVVVRYNPIVSLDMLEAVAERPDHAWFRSGEPPLLVALGRLTDQKDFPTLLYAFDKVRRSRRCRLLILGEGERRAELERLVSALGLRGIVDLPGFRLDRLRYLAHARLLVLSSVWEGLPTVLIEALALGIPIVATDCPSGPDEILAGGEYGRLVPMRDPGRLADAILRSLDEQPDREYLKGRGQEFTVERGGDGYLKLMGLLEPAHPSAGRSDDPRGSGIAAVPRARHATTGLLWEKSRILSG